MLLSIFTMLTSCQWGADKIGDFNSISHLDDGIGKSGHSKLMEKKVKHPDTLRIIWESLLKSE